MTSFHKAMLASVFALTALVSTQSLTAFAQCYHQSPYRPYCSSVIMSRCGYLSHNDPMHRVRYGSHYDVHGVFLHAGRTYVIDLTGCFDTYLRVESGCGCHVLAENDDGGNGLNSRIYFTPPHSGNYRILASSFRADATGNYTLTIRR